MRDGIVEFIWKRKNGKSLFYLSYSSELCKRVKEKPPPDLPLKGEERLKPET